MIILERCYHCKIKRNIKTLNTASCFMQMNLMIKFVHKTEYNLCSNNMCTTIENAPAFVMLDLINC